MGERLSAEDREQILILLPNCTQCGKRFTDSACGFAHALIQTNPGAHNLLEPLVAAAVAEERERIAAEIEMLPLNEGYNTRAQAGYVTAQYDAARIARGDQ